MTPAEYLASAAERGLSITYNGFTNQLFLSPKEAIAGSDGTFIKSNREAIVSAIIAATPVACADHPDRCRGVCPGPLHELCAGCADITEYLMPDGLIASGWCLEDRDIATATHKRNRWDGGAWQKIDTAIPEEPTDAI